MTKPPKRPRDPNQLAKMMVDIARGETVDDQASKNPSAVAFGKQGGVARAQSLTKEERAEISKRAAKVRWSKS
jgi:hypothetical protein